MGSQGITRKEVVSTERRREKCTEGVRGRKKMLRVVSGGVVKV